MRMIDRRATWVACLLLVWGAAGCTDADVHAPDWDWARDWDVDWPTTPDTRAKAEAAFDVTWPAAPALTLVAVAGSVEIVGAPAGGDIRLEGTRRARSWTEADARARLEELQVDVDRTGATLDVETLHPESKRGRTYEIDYRITVPEGTELTVRFAAGPVSVRSIRGKVDVDGAAGSVELDDVEADVDVRVAAGAIDARLTLPANGRVALSTSAGNILLRIPEDASAGLRGSSVTGVVRLVNLDLDDQDPLPTVVRGTLAGGDGSIDVSTAAGDVTVRGVRGAS